MKYLILTITFLSFLTFDASARGKLPFCSDCEYIEIVQDLPDTENYQTEDNQFLELGYFYKQFWILWIPLWNSDGEYCLTDAEATTIYQLTPEELDEIATAENISLAANPIPFWDKIGGKIVLLLVIGLIIYGKFFGKDDEETPEVPTEES